MPSPWPPRSRPRAPAPRPPELPPEAPVPGRPGPTGEGRGEGGGEGPPAKPRMLRLAVANALTLDPGKSRA
eukprot:3604739-Pyramimonas_sp.AAC.1